MPSSARCKVEETHLPQSREAREQYLTSNLRDSGCASNLAIKCLMVRRRCSEVDHGREVMNYRVARHKCHFAWEDAVSLLRQARAQNTDMEVLTCFLANA